MARGGYGDGWGVAVFFGLLGVASVPFFVWQICRFVWWLVSHLHWS